MINNDINTDISDTLRNASNITNSNLEILEDILWEDSVNLSDILTETDEIDLNDIFQPAPVPRIQESLSPER